MPTSRSRARACRRLLPLLIGIGFLVGALSGFFGIGGGFLIVPGLMGATAMPLINAIGSSLVSVTAFGLTTAASYACSGLVDWPLAGTVHCRRRTRRRCSASGSPRISPAYKHALTLDFFRHRDRGRPLRHRPVNRT